VERVLITGLTGRSGGYFLKELEKAKPEGMRFSAIVRSSSNVSAIESSCVEIELRRGNLYDENFLREATKDIDTLLHIAGTRKSLRLVQAAVQNGVKRLILVHTTGIFSKYQSAKQDYIRIEQGIREAISGRDISLTILRPTMIYGSANDGTLARFFAMVKKLPVIPLVGAGRYALQPVHHSDLGRAYYLVLTNPQATADKEYNLSGAEKIDFIDLMKEIGKLLGKKPLFFPVPLKIAHGAACFVRMLSRGRVDYREKVLRMAEDRSFSHEAASRDFGYAPLPLRDGLKRELEAIQSAQKPEK